MTVKCPCNCESFLELKVTNQNEVISTNDENDGKVIWGHCSNCGSNFDVEDLLIKNSLTNRKLILKKRNQKHTEKLNDLDTFVNLLKSEILEKKGTPLHSEAYEINL